MSDFKVPVVPSSRMKNHKPKRLLSISPIENVPVNTRRSLRLSLKKIETSYDNNITSQSSHFDTTLRKNDTSVVNDNTSCDFTKRRTSVRLAAKINAKKYDINLNNTDTSLVNDSACDFTKKRTSVRLAAKINAAKYDINVNNTKNSKNYKKKNVVVLSPAGKRLLKKNG